VERLDKLRKDIDNLDKKIIEFLNQRAKLSLEINRIKLERKRQIYSPDREIQILRRISKINKGPLKNRSLEAIYREIFSSNLSLIKSLKIAYLGPEATFTHLAALKKFGSQVEYLACNTISDVFLEVDKEKADYGVVPIENTIEGAVSHTLDMFIDSDLKICSEIILSVSLNLLANCSKRKIKRIYSAPQVFGQCRNWLANNLADIEKIEVSSTTKAAQLCKRQKNSACIASILAAKEYNLRIVARDIEDFGQNITRFLVIGKSDCPPTGKDKTSIMFSIKDRVGALHDMLTPFKKYRINLTKIESRPSKKKAWDYYFFIDLEGHRHNSCVKRALSELEKKAITLKILGSYPVGE
jgi:chorismate mutase/prephenate dehydratase